MEQEGVREIGEDDSPNEPPQAGTGPPADTDTEKLEPRPKANTLNRGIAKFIDILIALLLARLPGYTGFLAGLAYVAVADGLMGGRSPGKRIIGLRVLYKSTGRPVDYRGSIIRNSTMGALYILSAIPIVGWIVAVLGLGLELLLIIGSAEGMRLGDEIASTVVADEINA